MSTNEDSNIIRTRIWQEEAEPNNPFATRAAYCHGYDVYGEIVGNGRWIEMLYLLFRGERPSIAQANQFETLAVALANPGPREASVHAAMCGGACGSTAASCLMSALAVGAGSLGGAREVFLLMTKWESCGNSIETWLNEFSSNEHNIANLWPDIEHPPGFDPNGLCAATVVVQTLQHLARFNTPHIQWLEKNRGILESTVGLPLAMSSVAAAAFIDLGFKPEQGEMVYLMLRLPGAAAHALEQRGYGHKQFPFFEIEFDRADDGADA